MYFPSIMGTRFLVIGDVKQLLRGRLFDSVLQFLTITEAASAASIFKRRKLSGGSRRQARSMIWSGLRIRRERLDSLTIQMRDLFLLIDRHRLLANFQDVLHAK